MKGCEELKDWIDPIVNHFWYCCQVADGSVEELKVHVIGTNFFVPLLTRIFYNLGYML